MSYLIVVIASWIVAQGSKKILHNMGYNRRVFSGDRSGVLLSGGMPSAHSAVVVSLATIIGLGEGWHSSVFALSMLFSVVVMYDATMVRYASGKQGEAINQLISEKNSKIKPVRIAHGHTPVEVLAGAIIGLIVAAVVFFATKNF